ncbi:MAG: hypothetical protein LBO06_01875 [Bacteroidales bacterium]|jgi:hypothetical protein|nr:hypothetical protein [Bacteroidales bacterium]
MADWITGKEADLLAQADANEKYFISLGSQFSPTELQRFKAAVTAFKNGYTKAQDKNNVTHAEITAKNLAKKALKAIMREFYANYVYGNPKITADTLEQYQFPVHDKIPTPVPVPQTPPDFVIDFALGGLHKLFFGKFNSQNKITAGLPKGAHGVEVRRLTVPSETPPLDPDPEEMEFLNLASKSPFDVHYNKNSRGTKVYYAMRYFNDRGEHSEWSSVQMALVN